MAAGVNSDVTATWNAALDANGAVIDGSTPITGYVATVMSGTTSIASCAVPPGATPTSDLTCTLTGLGYGKTYTVQVVANNAVGSSSPPATSAPFPTAPGLSQIVTITGAPSGTMYGDPSVPLAASATSGLTITWSTTSSSVCSVGNTGVVVLLGVGTCSIAAYQYAIGSHYTDASASVSFSVNSNLSASATGATSIHAASATLNARIPYPGANATPTFCISTTNSTASCSSPAGVMMGGATPAVITATSATTVAASVSGLQGDTTYYYWVKVVAGAASISSATSSFRTLVGPVLHSSGSTTGTTGIAMSISLTATSGSGVYSTWVASALPTGMSLNFTPGSASATITGIPPVAGAFNSLVTVTDDLGASASITLAFNISSPVVAPPSGGGGGGGGGGGAPPPPAPSPTATPTPTPTPSPTPTIIYTAGKVETRVEGPLPVSFALQKIFPTGSIVLTNSDPKSVKGVLDASALGGVVTITPLPTFSGKIRMPVTVTSGYVISTVDVMVEVDPARVTQTVQAPINSNSTAVSWVASPNATGYQIFVNGQLICETISIRCAVPKLLGPKAKIEVQATGNDGTISSRTLAAYSPAKPVEVAAVNFAERSAVIDSMAKKKLLTFVRLIRDQGFTSVVITGHTDNQGGSQGSAALSQARAKATFKFLSTYLVLVKNQNAPQTVIYSTGSNTAKAVISSLTIVAQGLRDPVASNKTKAGQAANRRAALLVR
jgi:outer membrane protein OmpA-like peptidoglycan-associated protein